MMVSTKHSALVSLLLLLSSHMDSVSSHSWLECSKYGVASDPPLDGKSYDPAACTGYPRGFSSRANAAFGGDTGFNVQPAPNWCANRAGPYPSNFPMATYAMGEKVRLVWPAKNHDAAECTNPFIPDTEMKIYMTGPVTDAQIAAGYNGPADIASWTLVVDFKTTQIPATPNPEGFQRCPDFCGPLGTDKAICFQDFMVPTNLQANSKYLFLWFWIFNAGGPNTAYTTCWDALIEAQGQVTGGSSPVAATVAPGAQASVSFKLTSTGGTFDQTRLTSAVATQLGVQACAVVLTSFSGDLQSFNVFYSVNVAQSATASTMATVSGAAFKSAMDTATGGSVVVATPTTGAAAAGGCAGSGSRVTTYSLTLVLQLSGSPLPAAVDVSVAIDEILLNSEGMQADVGCTTTNATAGASTQSYSCSVILFSSADSVKAQTYFQGAVFPSVLAANARMACCSGSQIQTTSVSQNVRPSTNLGTGGSRRNVQLSPMIAAVSLLAVIGTVFGVF